MGSLSLKLRVGFALGAIVLAPGCAKETGILLVVDRDDSVPADVDHLEFAVGVTDPSNLGGGSRFQLDVPSSITVPMSGRDLKVTPYELLIHPDDVSASIVVAVTAWDGQGQIVGFGALDTAQPFIEGKVLMSTVTLTGTFDAGWTDTGCVKFYPSDGGDKIIIAPPNDRDCDGDGIDEAPPDCDDTNPGIGPSQTELCETTDIDEDCDGDPIEDFDTDGDGQSRCLGDCNDDDPEVNSLPTTVERCDGKDNDCNSACDEIDAFDTDHDGYTICGTHPEGDGTCVHGEECDDLNPNIHGEAPELCDGIDNDCNGVCDDGDENDVDGDTFTPCGTIVGMCNDPTPQLSDCQPDLDWAHPFADEICDGVDTNCDGTLMETAPCFVSETGDPAVCSEGRASCDDSVEPDGTFGLGTCMPDSSGMGAGNLAPGALCSSYGSCFTGGSIDPWICSFDAGIPAVTVNCNVKVTGPLLQTCTSNTAPLNGDPVGSNCSWWVYGGTQQRHYDVGMSNILSPTPSGRIDGCLGTFHVTGKRDPFPQPESMWLGYMSATDSAIQVVQVNLTPTIVATCPISNALECTIAIP